MTFMTRGKSALVASWLVILSGGFGYLHAGGQAPRSLPEPAATVSASGVPATGNVEPGALVRRYCVTCHNARLKTGDLVLENLDLADVAAHSATWEKVVRKVRAGMMPPPGLPR